MREQYRIPLFDLIGSLSEATDLISTALVDHHKRVAYIALMLSQELGLSEEIRQKVVLAGMLHDIGAISVKERLNLLEFEAKSPQHAEVGCYLTGYLDSVVGMNLSNLIKFHHASWESEETRSLDEDERLQANILHLADRIAVLINNKSFVLEQIQDVENRIAKNKRTMFAPEGVDAFKSLAEKEYVWLDFSHPNLGRIIGDQLVLKPLQLDLKGLVELSNIFRRMIDFRSRFTHTHSCGVSASAEAMAKLIGFPENECLMLRTAGHLHDLGKLAVPVEILEKPGKLTRSEFAVIRSHTYHTYRILDPIRALDQIKRVGAYHHERLNGRGYPFHVDDTELTVSARILAVADVFTATAEDRPYRKGMDAKQVLGILNDMVDVRSLDETVVSVLRKNFDFVTQARREAQKDSSNEYKEVASLSMAPSSPIA